MDAVGQSTAIHTLAVALSKCLSREQAAQLSLLLIQLGTTLDTIVALGELNAEE